MSSIANEIHHIHVDSVALCFYQSRTLFDQYKHPIYVRLF